MFGIALFYFLLVNCSLTYWAFPLSPLAFELKKSGKKIHLKMTKKMNNLMKMIIHRVLPTVMLRKPSR